MEWLFGKRVTPEEMLRKNQRALNKAIRDLDRERQRMEQQEKKIIADIKKMAKEGQMVCIKLQKLLIHICFFLENLNSSFVSAPRFKLVSFDWLHNIQLYCHTIVEVQFIFSTDLRLAYETSWPT